MGTVVPRGAPGTPGRWPFSPQSGRGIRPPAVPRGGAAREALGGEQRGAGGRGLPGCTRDSCGFAAAPPGARPGRCQPGMSAARRRRLGRRPPGSIRSPRVPAARRPARPADTPPRSRVARPRARPRAATRLVRRARRRCLPWPASQSLWSPPGRGRSGPAISVVEPLSSTVAPYARGECADGGQACAFHFPAVGAQQGGCLGVRGQHGGAARCRAPASRAAARPRRRGPARRKRAPRPPRPASSPIRVRRSTPGPARPWTAARPRPGSRGSGRSPRPPRGPRTAPLPPRRAARPPPPGPRRPDSGLSRPRPRPRRAGTCHSPPRGAAAAPRRPRAGGPPGRASRADTAEADVDQPRSCPLSRAGSMSSPGLYVPKVTVTSARTASPRTSPLSAATPLGRSTATTVRPSPYRGSAAARAQPTAAADAHDAVERGGAPDPPRGRPLPCPSAGTCRARRPRPQRGEPSGVGALRREQQRRDARTAPREPRARVQRVAPVVPAADQQRRPAPRRPAAASRRRPRRVRRRPAA